MLFRSTARTLGKDLQNQQGAIVHRQTQMAFEVALLSGGKRLIKQHLRCAMQRGHGFDFIGLARANEHGGVGGFALAGQARNGLQASGQGQLRQFIQLRIKMRQTEINTYQ